MRLAIAIIVPLAIVFWALVFAVTSNYMWLPDVFTRDVTIVNYDQFKGQPVAIWQFWNGRSYATFFSLYSAPDAPMKTFLLSEREWKCWYAWFEMDSDKVYVNGGHLDAAAYSASTDLVYIGDGSQTVKVGPHALSGEYAVKEVDARRLLVELLSSTEAVSDESVAAPVPN